MPIENELKRIADSLEVIAMNLQTSTVGQQLPSTATVTGGTAPLKEDTIPQSEPVEPPKPKRRRRTKAEIEANKTPTPAAAPAEDLGGEEYSREEMLDEIRLTVKAKSRDAVVKVLGKYGYKSHSSEIADANVGAVVVEMQKMRA